MHLHVEPLRQLTEELIDAVAAGGEEVRLCSVFLFGSSLWSRGRDIDVLAVLETPTDWTPQRNVRVADSLRRLRNGSRTVDPFVRSSNQFARARQVVGTLEHLVASHGSVIEGTPPPPIVISDEERSTIAEASAQAWLATASRNLVEPEAMNRWRGRRGAERAIAMASACLLQVDPPGPASSDAAWSAFLSNARTALTSLQHEATCGPGSSIGRLVCASLIANVDAHSPRAPSHTV